MLDMNAKGVCSLAGFMIVTSRKIDLVILSNASSPIPPMTLNASRTRQASS